MILHLVRHPKPVVPPGTCYGRLDVPAIEVEETAARLQGTLPRNLPVWTSPLRRCRELARHLHPSPQVDGRLAEMHFGEWEGRAWNDISVPALDAWAADVAGFAPPGGESPRALQVRALDWVAEVRASGASQVVAVTHAGVMRVLVAHRENVPPDRWATLNFAYGEAIQLVL